MVRRFVSGMMVVMLAQTASAQFPPAQLKNVKALPANIPVNALIDTMRGFTRALGVRCTYCHVGSEDQSLAQYDFVSDDKVAKQKARDMIRMVLAINGQYLANIPARSSPPVVVNCITCHRGVSQPRPIEDLVVATYSSAGIDSAIATYRALRNRYYGRSAYDFGEVPLADAAASLQKQGKSQDAIKLYRLNAELLPNSSFAYRQLGMGLLQAGDTTGALAAWQHRLAIDPQNPEAKQMVDRLTKKP